MSSDEDEAQEMYEFRVGGSLHVFTFAAGLTAAEAGPDVAMLLAKVGCGCRVLH
jgi:hypothetical protein